MCTYVYYAKDNFFCVRAIIIREQKKTNRLNELAKEETKKNQAKKKINIVEFSLNQIFFR